ncbi:MAG: YbhB/YbcL family Raf kinase inhibitor-like protein [Candidatus Nanohaloarchaea archaeon]
MKLTSPAFDDGGMMPEKYGYTRQNVNPPLRFKEVPEETASLVLLVDDPDAVEPAGKVWDHWTVWNIPAGTAEVEEGSTPPGAVEGMTDFGEPGYGGPNPPDGEHTYRFRLYALDTRLDLPANATKEDVQDAMEGHVLDTAELEGTFAPL